MDNITTYNTDSNEISASKYYDADYFNWQKNMGAFGGWANSYIFQKYISKHHIVIDFGCGGGYLLHNLKCKKRIGIEPNLTAANSVLQLGIQHFQSPTDALNALGISFADVIISTNVLEHTLNPLEELKNLCLLLKKGGAIHFVVPCDSISYLYNPKDINYHLYSWSPQNIGNLFTEAGYSVEFSRPYMHKWPPLYNKIAKLGWPIFNIICKIYGNIEKSWSQVEVRAIKNK